MNWLGRTFLPRRRWDARLLLVGTMLAPLRLGALEVAAIFHALAGIYVALFARNRGRLFGQIFYASAIAYAAWAVRLALWHSKYVGTNNEYMFALLFAGLFFIGPGLILNRDPLRTFVLGARLGIAISLLSMPIYLMTSTDPRLGAGGNPAPFAFLMSIWAVASMIRVRQPPRFLPNIPVFAVLALIPIFASETRAVLVFAALAILFELIRDTMRLPALPRNLILASLCCAIIGLAAYGPVNRLLHERFLSLYQVYVEQNVGETSMNTRFAMWSNALDLVKANPVAGLGADRMDRLRAAAPEQAEYLNGYRHVHNFVLDELLMHGIVGLVLLIASLGGLVLSVWRNNPDASVRRNIVYFSLLFLSYGSFHSPLLHEMSMCMMFVYLGVMNANATRIRMHTQKDQTALP